jgi:hypothetical protein
MKFHRVIGLVVISLIPLQALSRDLSRERAEAFIDSLIQGNSVECFVDPRALHLSRRLGIQYEGTENKSLISYEIDPSIGEKLEKNRAGYEIAIHSLDNDLSRLDFLIPGLDYKKEFYFSCGLMISPVSLFTRDWTIRESEHFRFIISDDRSFNTYCIDNLERFYSRAAGMLAFSEEQDDRIRSQKIYYILCKDGAEIERLTGFNTRGMYNLAYDLVVTTFNAHYHELMHLLMNYGLHRLELYTHPFLLEGFAAAFGGRGGKEPEVILRLGLFLQKSNMLDYTDLLSKDGFYDADASLSYPLAGLYNRFLFDEVGVEKYIALYKKYSGTADEIDRMTIDHADLPHTDHWREFIEEFSRQRSIEPEPEFPAAEKIYSVRSARILEDSTRYYFEIKDTLLVPSPDGSDAPGSRKFTELFGDGEYRGEKYAILASASEISIYNLYTNNLIANYVRAFSIPPEPVPCDNGLYRFSVKKSVFDEDLGTLYRDVDGP